MNQKVKFFVSIEKIFHKWWWLRQIQIQILARFGSSLPINNDTNNINMTMMIILAAEIPRGVTLVQCFESEFEE